MKWRSVLIVLLSLGRYWADLILVTYHTKDYGAPGPRVCRLQPASYCIHICQGPDFDARAKINSRSLSSQNRVSAGCLGRRVNFIYSWNSYQP
ncbi:hypothetical protein GGS21DRAFT_536353 [Xylaria nigripes]|nr:hypothetical protein GGS21DRAFT_536353 [Xylaria nigripes]